MFPTADKAIEAIEARKQGILENPTLLRFGLPSTDEKADIESIKVACLRAYGWTVGPRDPRLNRKFSGKFMVVEPFEEDELPTDDGSNGPWCIVGDDLPELINTGYAFLLFCVDDGPNGH